MASSIIFLQLGDEVWAAVIGFVSDGTVKSFQKISDTAGDFTATLDDDDGFGVSVADIGDINGDGITDLAVGADFDDDGGTDRGAIYILFMDADGTLDDTTPFQKIADGVGGITGNTLDDVDTFGRSVAKLTDLNGDSITDLVVGAFRDDDGVGNNHGAVYVLFLNGNLIKTDSQGDRTAPSFGIGFAENEYPVIIDNTTFKMSDLATKVDTVTGETGKSIQVKVLVFDEIHSSEIQIVNLLTNLRGGLRTASGSDTGIYFQTGNPPTVIDPNGYFSNVDVSTTVKGGKLEVTFDITFEKEMDTSDIIIQVRDRSNNSVNLQVIEGWKIIKSTAVEEPSIPEEPTIPGEEPSVVLTGEADFTSLATDKTLYRKNDKIIFSGTITNSDEIVTITIHDPNGKFVKLISAIPDDDGNFQAQVDSKYYFNLDGTYTAIAFTSDKNKVTTIPFKFLSASRVEPKDTETNPFIVSQEIVVPSWLKNSAGWWSNDLIRDDEFVKGIQYLINEEILRIPETEQTGTGSAGIPGWIKNNAGWWADDLLTDYDFVQGIQWLIANGIMKV